MLKVLKLILIPLSYLIILYVFFSIGNIYPRYSYILMAIGSIFASLIIYLIFKKKVRVDGDGKNIKKLNLIQILRFAIYGSFSNVFLGDVAAFISKDFSDTFSPAMIGETIYTVFAAPISEEVIYRKLPYLYIQTIKDIRLRVFSYVTIVFVFVLSHDITSLNYSIITLISSIIYFYVYIKYNNIVYSIIMHMFFNLISFIERNIKIIDAINIQILHFSVEVVFVLTIIICLASKKKGDNRI